MKPISAKIQLTVTVAILLLLAVAGIVYKLQVLGFSLHPNEQVTVWQVEGRIDFMAHNQPIRVSLAAPEAQSDAQVLSANEISPPSYHFSFTDNGNLRRAQWTSAGETGPQTIFIKTKIFDVKEPEIQPAETPPVPEDSFLWEDPASRLAAQKLLKRLQQESPGHHRLILNLLECVFGKAGCSECIVLMGKNPSTDTRLNLMLHLLADLKLPTRLVYGVILQDGRRRQLVKTFEVFHDGYWRAYDPKSRQSGFPEHYLILRRGDKSLLDVEGGTDSSVRFSVFKSTEPLMNVVPTRARSQGHTFGSFSVYSLPLESQNMFKRIALIPLGILIVVIVRNLIGIQTMGTFMPVLIAMAFLETRLVPGLISFLAITAVGLLIRTLLSRLNLLLVPRIAAVVLVVILLMKGFCIVSFRLGFTAGLSVTMFPLVIMAWTIERASILWEEDGPINTFKQFGASLLTGLFCYMLMASPYVQHITFAFSEIDLIILALILLLGSYTGYRLTELRRFNSLVRK